MVLSPPTPSELAAEIKKLKVNKATSDKQIPTKFLIIAADVISPYSVYLVNFMFSNGILPDVLKIAKGFPYTNLVQINPLKIIDRFHHFHLFQKLLKIL